MRPNRLRRHPTLRPIRRSGGRAVERAATALVLVAVAVAIAGCRGSKVADGHEMPASDVDLKSLPGLSHVHGLGVDPADDSLLIATHFGLWRAEGDEPPRRIGKFAHDFMGFTVVGPRRYIASGHPNSAPDLPPLLGLIETTDAGKSWRTVSLLGDADFHGLRRSDGRTFGWNSSNGDLMVSHDLEQWDVLDEAVPLADFAVSPDGETILGIRVVDEKPQLARLEGKGEWERVSEAPALVRIAWAGGDEVAGFGPDGEVWRSADGGGRWRQVGDVEEAPEAATVADERWIVAGAGSIRQSTDDGASWETLHTYDS